MSLGNEMSNCEPGFVCITSVISLVFPMFLRLWNAVHKPMHVQWLCSLPLVFVAVFVSWFAVKPYLIVPEVPVLIGAFCISGLIVTVIRQAGGPQTRTFYGHSASHVPSRQSVRQDHCVTFK